MSQKDLKIEIKKIIGQHDQIKHGQLLEKIKEKELMAKKTAEKYIKQLCDEREIHPYKVGQRKTYSLTGNETSQKKMIENFKYHIDEFRKKADEYEEKFPNYPYDVQIFMYDSFLSGKQVNIPYIESRLKCTENEDEERFYESEFFKSMQQIKKLTWDHKLNDYEMREPFNELSNLLSEKLEKRLELKKQISHMKTSKKRDIIRDEIKKLSSELDNMLSQMEKTIRTLECLKKHDKLPFEFDEKIIKLKSIKNILDKSVENVQEFQKRMNKFKVDEKLQNKDFKKINSHITTIETSLENIEEDIEKIKSDSISNELHKDVHLQIAQLIKVIKNMRST